MSYLIHLLIMIGIYTLIAYPLNLLIGYGGILSLASAAFFGIGAYTYALLSIHFHVTFIYAILGSIGITALLAFLTGIPALRFRGNLFVIVTLGFETIIYTLLYNWIKLTKGPYGISGISQPVLSLHLYKGGITINSLFSYLVLILVINVLVLYFLYLIYKSPFGRALKALREDELSALSIGKPAQKYYLYAFVISSALLAIPGGLYASYITYIDPTSFTVDESIFQVAILIIGGSGNTKGPIVGVVFMMLLPEILRLVGFPDTVAANMRQIIYGLILIVLMHLRPQGLLGEYKVK